MELNYSEQDLILHALKHMEAHLGEYAPIVAQKYYALKTKLEASLQSE